MRLFRFLVIAVVLIWYGLSIGILHNQPVQFVHPFEYYQSEDLSLMQLNYLFLIITPVFLIMMLFGHYLKSVLSLKILLIVTLIGLLLITWNRFSIVFYLSISLLIVKLLSNRMNQTVSVVLVGMLFFIVMIPGFILRFNHESFLDVDGFQRNIEAYVKGSMFERFQYNLEQIPSLLWLIILMVILSYISINISQYLFDRSIKISIISLLIVGILFIMGTMLRGVMYLFSDYTLIWLGIIFGAFVQSMSIAYFIIALGRSFKPHTIEMKNLKSVVFAMIASLIMSDAIAPIIYTNWTTFGVTHLNTLLSKGSIFTICIYILFMLIVMINKKRLIK